MNDILYSVITGTGRYVPSQTVGNEQFLSHTFYNPSGEKMLKSTNEIIEKFHQITQIEERRYIEEDYVASDMGFWAAQNALANACVDKEMLDYIIVAHNFGDVLNGNRKTDLLPSLAARIKHKLGIKNPNTIAYDIAFGCPGWIQALIQADYYIKSGDVQKVLVIGTETLSRISDPHDIDSLLYADGAGAVIVEARKNRGAIGIVKHKIRSDTFEQAHLLKMGVSYNPAYQNDTIFLKMQGKKLYEYALNTVPQLVKDCIEAAGLQITDIKKVLIHQANAKMNHAILSRLLKLYDIKQDMEDIMPMTISKFGNTSVATVPILFDLLIRGELKNHEIAKGDYLVFASVGAGMNVNTIVYKIP